ncbi:MAG: response regulator [Candidatus Cloacimonetes bacterium]|nr:response regulator [Candidatus Cloacimonadota bacterium]
MTLKKILLIEDEPDIQEITRSALELVGGFDVLAASGGMEGIALAESNVPDLILMDMMMPGLDGAETLKLMRQNSKIKMIPVVFMTAKVQAHEIQQYIDLGAVDVIPKPFDPMQISNQIYQIWSSING